MRPFPQEEELRDAWLDHQCALLAIKWVEIHLLSLSPKQTPPWTRYDQKKLVADVVQSGGMLNGKTLPGVSDWLVEYAEARDALEKTGKTYQRLLVKRYDFYKIKENL